MTPEIRKLAEDLLALAGKATPGGWTAIGPDDTPSKIGYTHPTKGWNVLFDIRGWGHFTGQGHGALGMSEEDALAQQKANGDYVTACSPDAITKLAKQVLSSEGQRLTVIDEIAAERQRQQKAEGWSATHDDEHDNGSIAQAAAAYALNAAARSVDALSRGAGAFQHDVKVPIFGRTLWPWDLAWWKPKDPRRDLIRAGALIVAEIERLDRLTQAPHETSAPPVKEGENA